ncbi:MAG: phosphoribosyltransferase [Vicinamibacteria bacterium]
MRFRDRTDAGKQLATRLGAYRKRPDVLVLALPRGGVPVAAEVADALGAPLDVFLVRKLGVPGQDELAMGAVASGGVRILNEEVVEYFGISWPVLEEVTARERRELDRRERRYRHGLDPIDPRGKTVLLVDDGLATGSTMLASVEALRRLGPANIVVAVPVAPPSTARKLAKHADEVVCVLSPEPFDAVGNFYVDFSQTTDEEVCAILERARTPYAAPSSQS